jgi:hypothetical protein
MFIYIIGKMSLPPQKKKKFKKMFSKSQFGRFIIVTF